MLIGNTLEETTTPNVYIIEFYGDAILKIKVDDNKNIIAYKDYNTVKVLVDEVYPWEEHQYYKENGKYYKLKYVESEWIWYPFNKKERDEDIYAR